MFAPNSLILLISKEYKVQKSQKSRRSRKAKDDTAMAVGSSSKGKGKPKHPRGVCWNCGKKGHFKNKCLELATTDSKSAKGPKKEVVLKKSYSANAVESDYEIDEAFLMEPVSDSSKSESFGNGDWFDEISELDSEENNWFSKEEVDECFASASELTNWNRNQDTHFRAEIYDSGCTKHISPRGVRSTDHRCQFQL
jgi:hypothetical protein